MKSVFIIAVTFLYLGQAVVNAYHRDWPGVLIWASYASANIGLILALT